MCRLQPCPLLVASQGAELCRTSSQQDRQPSASTSLGADVQPASSTSSVPHLLAAGMRDKPWGVLAEMMCLAPSSSQIILQQLKVFNASSSVAEGFSALVQCCAQTVSC